MSGRDIRKVCLVASLPGLERGFREAGCEVLTLHPEGGGLLDLPATLEERGFRPDLLVQREQLSGPNVLLGLDALDCPKIFWSLDTHLGMWWQGWYARLFDGVLTTQKHLADGFMRLPDWDGAVDCLPWAGYEREWTPFARRPDRVGFVGRVTPDRPIRARLVEFLRSRWQARCQEGLSFEEMCAAYDQTCIAPNESIFGEVNFRVFETASSGCLPVLQDIGHPLDHVLVPGREAEVYADAAELADILDHYLDRPEAAERLGRAAWERVQREHLFTHRARRILDFAMGLQARALSGVRADRARLLAQHGLWLGGRAPFPPGALERGLLALGNDPEARAALLELYAAVGQPDKAVRLLDAMASDSANSPQGDLQAGGQDMIRADLAVSATALRFGDMALARRVYVRTLARLGAGPAPEDLAGEGAHDSGRLLKAWARTLRKLGRTLRPGFRFHSDRHLPATAVECLAMALEADPDDSEAHRLLDGCLAGVRGAEHLRVGFFVAPEPGGAGELASGPEPRAFGPEGFPGAGRGGGDSCGPVPGAGGGRGAVLPAHADRRRSPGLGATIGPWLRVIPLYT